MRTDRTSFLGVMGLAVMLMALQIGCQQAEEPAATSSSQTTAGSPGQPARSRPAGQSGSSAGSSASAPASSQPRTVTLAVGTVLKVRTTNAISTESHKTGDTFSGTLEEPVVEGGWVIAPKGSAVEGGVIDADKGGRVQGVAHLTLALDMLHSADGQSLEISTGPFTVEARTTKTKDATKVAIGTGIGAAIGAIAGGGKGAGIGAATGAGAGTGVVLATRGDAAEIASETVLNFELNSPVTVTEKK
ncbi:MAG: hypothetical protein A3G20_02265 [Acidobacteria bacterium RIFCSPLOWO2_12_FULL_59_11]|nr:MAG: hypothetical protein A3G20_02265 [Acidobacteria bacterium RIFCSPLOWO2_12_FULL_59_11]